MPPCHLIVNADDFGFSESVNEGVAEAHERGVVTSATLMVRWPAAAGAARYGRSHPELSVGLHVDLGEWEYRDGEWHALYEVVDTADLHAVEAEVGAQLDSFAALMGRPPTHLDSHQHVHRNEPVAGVLGRAGARLGVPVRHFHRAPAYRGDFYGQSGKGEPYPEAITVDALVALIEDLPDGWTELGCHPGRPDPELPSPYRDERAVETRVLCDPRVRAAVRARGAGLVSFHRWTAPG